MRGLVFACSAVAAVFLMTALVFQYGFKMHPCELCMAQRVPYGVIAMLGLMGGMSLKARHQLAKVALICGILFLTDAGIAAYHSAVELGWVKGPSGCTNNDTGEQTLEQMRAAIMNAQLVPCDQPMGYFLGLSMATWNLFAASAAGVLTFVMLARISKRAGA